MSEAARQGHPGGRGRLRVLVMTSTFPRYPGDPEPAFVYELNERLSAHFDLDVLAPHAPGLATEEVVQNQRVTRFRYAPEAFENLAYQGGMLSRLRRKPLRYLLVPVFLLAQYRAAVRIIRSRKIDIVHAHWLLPQGLVAALIRVTMPKAPPVLCTSHGADLFSLQGKLMARLKKWIIGRCNSVTVVSRSMASRLLDLGVPPSKVHVAPMGVDLRSRFIPDETRRSPRTLISAGRLVEKKGVIHLLEALPQVLARHPDIRLTIAGGGPEEPRLQARAASLGIADRVEFLGPLENRRLPPVYQSGGIAVFPFVVSKSGDQEGLGLVVVEALGCGCAVIASDLPAIRDVVSDGETGKTVQPANPEALARTIVALLDDYHQCAPLASNGRQWALKNFDWPVVADNYCRLLHSLRR